jgi:flagellar basal-body rod modification protein FlgD
MTTTPIGSATIPTTAPTTSSTSSSPNLNLTSSDFVNMMIKQLQSQDPLNPTSSDQLMSQMSEIGQMQTSTQLQTTLSGLATQTQIGAASSLMGKQVTGIDANNNNVSGVVQSLQVSSSGVTLALDSGNALPLGNVTTVSPAPTATGATTTTPTAGPTVAMN